VAILALPNIGRQRQLELLEGPLSHYRKVLVIPDLLEAPSLWIRPRDLNGILGLEITSNLTHPMAQIIKRLADILFVYITLPLWLPISAILFAAIWIEDRCNPFFLQTRIGQDGKTFRTWKFRTMVPNAEEVLRKSLLEDDAMRLEWETTYKLRNDPRITKVGKFLRRSSLDELPQIINVLRGEMSLVGPRPLPQYHHLELPARVRDLRQRVLPGLTGLWQVSGRSDIGTEGMEQHDPYYVRNWSMWLDLVVLARTLRTVASRSGAY
jgi:Undecaprenyl-phosphate galactose phosphotransferase WbaP